MYQQQQAFQAQPLKQLREAHNDDDGYYGYADANTIINNGEDDEEQSQLTQRSVNNKLTSTTPKPVELAATSSIVLEKSTENITIKVGQQAVLPCFINNLGSYKVSFFFFNL